MGEEKRRLFPQTGSIHPDENSERPRRAVVGDDSAVSVRYFDGQGVSVGSDTELR